MCDNDPITAALGGPTAQLGESLGFRLVKKRAGNLDGRNSMNPENGELTRRAAETDKLRFTNTDSLTSEIGKIENQHIPN